MKTDRRTVILNMMLALTAIGFFMIVIVPIYSASARLKLDRFNASPLKYRAGDCIDMTFMHMTKDGGWDSSGYLAAQFKILEVVSTEKMNTYMAERLHAKTFYKIQILDLTSDVAKYHKGKTYVIPVQDLDAFRYASVFWFHEGTRDGVTCNSYDKDRE